MKIIQAFNRSVRVKRGEVGELFNKDQKKKKKKGRGDRELAMIITTGHVWKYLVIKTVTIMKR